MLCSEIKFGKVKIENESYGRDGMSEDKNNKLQVRNSTVDFLVFTRDAHEEGIEVRVQNHDVWLTQKAIGQLFEVDRSVVAKHLKNIFESGELSVDSTCANFAQVADNGKTYQYKFYSLAAIIAVGYRINSGRAMQFRQWATKVLDTFTKQGYVLDKSRLINGQIFDEDYFEHLISEIQEIRASERRFYQKITDIYATAVDYATRQARRHIPMTMEDWASKLDAFLQFNDAEVLQDKGKVTAAIAKAFAESEFEKYRVIQDGLYQSDFDRLIMNAEIKE